jgi:hypothetical protein
MILSTNKLYLLNNPVIKLRFSMGYSLTHYIRNFPLRYYLSGGLVRTEEPVISFFLAPENSAALLTRRHQVVGLESDIAGLPDAPPLAGAREEVLGVQRSFSTRLLTRWRMKGSPRFIFAPDLGSNDFYCNIHSLANLRELSAESLLEALHEEPRQVIGSWDEPRSFRWAVFDSRLAPLRGGFDRRIQQVMIIGIPAEYCEQAETWSDSQQGSLFAIIPAAVVCLKWFCEMVPTEKRTAFLLLLLAHTVVLAVVQEQQIILLRQYLEDALLAYQEIPTLADELRTENHLVYVWSAQPVPEDLARNLVGTELAGDVLRQINGAPVSIRRSSDGLKTETNAPVPHLLRWLEGRLA